MSSSPIGAVIQNREENSLIPIGVRKWDSFIPHDMNRVTWQANTPSLSSSSTFEQLRHTYAVHWQAYSFFSRSHRYVLMSLWACSVVYCVVECPLTSSPFFTISFITEAFEPLPSTFPQLEDFHCLLGHSQPLLKNSGCGIRGKWPCTFWGKR